MDLRLRAIDEKDIAKMSDNEDNDGQHDGLARNSTPNENVEWIEDENDEGLRAKFQMLRLRFRSMHERGALDEGTLSNVFIVVDAACAFSLFEAPDTDSVWVWAVDPDYNKPLVGEGTSPTLQHRYRGFLRVRSQHLVDKFFEVSKYHEEEYSMAALWEAAQRSLNRAFVSTKTGEQRLKRSHDLMSGTVLGRSRG